MGFGMVIPLLPFYAASFHAAPWQVALIFSAYSIGSFVGEPFWGRLSDRIGRKPVLLSTLACNCICYGLMAFAPNVYVAFVIRLFGGMFAGNGSVVQGYIADVTQPEERAGKMARIGVAFNIGFIVGPSISGLLAQPALGPAGFRIPFLVASFLGGCSALGVLVLVKESRARHHGPKFQPSRWAMLGKATAHPGDRAAAPFADAGLRRGLHRHRIHLWLLGPASVRLGPAPDRHRVRGASGITNAVAQWFITGRLSKQVRRGVACLRRGWG